MDGNNHYLMYRIMRNLLEERPTKHTGRYHVYIPGLNKWDYAYWDAKGEFFYQHKSDFVASKDEGKARLFNVQFWSSEFDVPAEIIEKQLADY